MFLHKFFEAQDEELEELIDAVAERARSLGGWAFGQCWVSDISVGTGNGVDELYNHRKTLCGSAIRGLCENQITFGWFHRLPKSPPCRLWTKKLRQLSGEPIPIPAYLCGSIPSEGVASRQR
ncbi:MAG TPA: hypothetical protein VGR30_08985 [Candidatus Binatia bacterium]|jgi:hypothetical protein|nr:hypothetical protein [Candidatus Binatia bacterium]